MQVHTEDSGFVGCDGVFWVCKRCWHVCHEDTEENGSIAPLSVNLGTR